MNILSQLSSQRGDKTEKSNKAGFGQIVNKIVTTLFIFLIFLTLAQIGTRIFHNQFDFDEGYNLQIALNLHENGRYATFDSLLDMNITTGPTVLIPAALLFRLSHPTLPRLVVAVYSAFLIFFVLSKYFSNRAERMLYLVLINLAPLFFLFSTVVLGELPGFVFLFFAYFTFSRSKYLAAGLLFSLSVLTKNVYIVGFIPLLIYGVYDALIHKNKQTSFKNYLYFFAGMIMPFGIWEGYKLFQFHFDYNRYIDYANNITSFTLSRSSAQFQNIEKRLAMIGYTFHIGGALFVFIVVFISSYVFVKSKSVLVKLLSAFTAAYTLYFICFGATNWYRHFFPGIASFLLILPQFLFSFFKTLNFERKLLISTFAVMLIVSLVNYIYKDKNEVFMKRLIEQNLLFLDQTSKPYIREKKILADQYDMAGYIRYTIHPDEKISGFVWLNSPEIAYLANRRIYRNPEEEDVQYVLSSIYDRFLDLDAPRIMERLLLEEIYSNDSYMLYKKNSTVFSKLL